MPNEPHKTPCFFCFTKFQMSAGRYEGRYIPGYQISVCKSCFDSNWDGWNPRIEPQLMAHLKEKGIPIPARNEKGWIPRGD